jgi:tetratricopeptide (TPR) repeat protein
MVESAPGAAVFVAAGEGMPSGLAPQLEAQLQAALKKTGVALATWSEPASTHDNIAAHLKLISEGRQAYDNLDIDGSIDKLTQARTYFLSHPGDAESGAMADLLLALGAAYLQNGLKVEAQKSFVEALLMNPDLKPSTKLFTADVQVAFANARKDLDKRPRGKLAIATTPQGAHAELRGQALGYTPLPTYELPIGRHLVKLKRTGYAPAGAYVEVVSGQTVEVKTTLSPLGDYDKALALAGPLILGDAFDANGIPDDAKTIAIAARTRFLVMVKMTVQGSGRAMAHTQVWDLVNFSRFKSVAFEMDNGGENAVKAAAALKRWMERPVNLVQRDPRSGTPDTRPVYKKWWFWTAVGTAVVIGAVSATVVATQHGRGGGDNLILGIP